DDLEAAALVLRVQLGEDRDLDLARPAPGRPEVQQNHFPLVVGKTDVLAVDVFQREVEIRRLRVGRTRGRRRRPRASRGLAARLRGEDRRACSKRRENSEEDSVAHVRLPARATWRARMQKALV